MIKLDIEPVAKPRMVRGDKYKKRPCVEKYWDYKNELLLCFPLEVELIREIAMEPFKLEFYVSMPKSWSKKNKKAQNGKSCRGNPDVDNLLKGFLDAIFDQDKEVWSVWSEKYWAYEGSIIVYPINNEIKKNLI